ncbi:hypothetical protein EG68_00004 [Paragonimus skrjabini miyazakii]|uniref:Uncharacterized protein n=1 Tax=Paragonimus skrjabini miyazakii TaxID=59628 RepID=A0A8S9ZB14_9TREM|nr:hypothetical protein EG68_00004 [Paragonimus skrjabini miyazakii]
MITGKYKQCCSEINDSQIPNGKGKKLLNCDGFSQMRVRILLLSVGKSANKTKQFLKRKIHWIRQYSVSKYVAC